MAALNSATMAENRGAHWWPCPTHHTVISMHSDQIVHACSETGHHTPVSRLSYTTNV